MRVRLLTGVDRLEFQENGERFASYVYDESAPPGFTELCAPGRRAITRRDEAADRALWLAHGNVNGIAFAPSSDSSSDARTGHIVSQAIMARRGSFSVGFQQECDWIAPDGQRLLGEQRTIRVAPGPAEGRILDITLRLAAPDAENITLGSSADSFLCLRAAAPLFPAGGGQVRNSAGDYGPARMHGRSAAWCACVGVVDGETCGFAFLDHPDNPWHPCPWIAREDGLLSPSPFPWRAITLAPRSMLTLRYRVLAHRGYVDAGWAGERLAEFARAPAP